MQFDKNSRFCSILHPKNGFTIRCIIILIVFLSICFDQNIGLCLGWPDIKTKLLPDESFAVVESDVGSRIRHCAHHDLSGNLHTEQLIYVLGTVDNEIWLNSKLKTVAKKHLEKHYDRFKTLTMKKGLAAPVNINEASLAELVLLPQIGPVLAVKIVEYRNANGMFMTIEDIKKIDGIGQGIYYAIQHYISLD
jgi:competence ComEA-like helix-hairpin-helix protein